MELAQQRKGECLCNHGQVRSVCMLCRLELKKVEGSSEGGTGTDGHGAVRPRLPSPSSPSRALSATPAKHEPVTDSSVSVSVSISVSNADRKADKAAAGGDEARNSQKLTRSGSLTTDVTGDVALQELLKEENDYCYKLYTLNSRLLDPLVKDDASSSISASFGFNRKDMVVLEPFFSSLQELSSLHEVIGEELARGQDILSALQTHKEAFKMYIPYSLHFQSVLPMLSGKKSWRFRSAMVKLRTETGVDLLETCQSVMHHLPKLEQLLKPVLTPSARRLATHLNALLQEMATTSFTKEQLALIEVHKTIKNSPFKHVIQPHRKYIRQGDFKTPRGEQVWYVLYNDLLIWTDKTRNYKGHVKLHEVLVEEDIGMVLKGRVSFFHFGLYFNAQEDEAAFIFYSNEEGAIQTLQEEVKSATGWAIKHVRPKTHSDRESLAKPNDNQTSLLEVHKSIKNSPFKHVVQPHRLYLAQGDFENVSGDSVWYVLYNDLLIWTDKTRNYKGHLKLCDVARLEEVGMLMKGKNSFFYFGLFLAEQEEEPVFAFFSNEASAIEQLRKAVDSAWSWARANLELTQNCKESMVTQSQAGSFSSFKSILRRQSSGKEPDSPSNNSSGSGPPSRDSSKPSSPTGRSSSPRFDSSPSRTSLTSFRIRRKMSHEKSSSSPLLEPRSLLDRSGPRPRERSSSRDLTAFRTSSRAWLTRKRSNSQSVSRDTSQRDLSGDGGDESEEELPVVEKEKLSDTALVCASYVPRQVVNRLMARDEDYNGVSAVQSTHSLQDMLLPDARTGEVLALQDAAVLIADISGFTKLNELLRQSMGVKGAEEVSAHINAYFSQILSICEKHGGDCIKFAGDALIVLFAREALEGRTGKAGKSTPYMLSRRLSKDEESTAELVSQGLDPSVPVHVRDALRAAQAAVELQAEAKRHIVSEDLSLTLHVAVGAGPVYAWHVGGYKGEWEFLISGPPFTQLAQILDLAGEGEVVVSKACWRLVQKRGTWQAVQKTARGKADTQRQLLSIVQGKGLVPHAIKPLPKAACNTEGLETALRAYVSRCVLDKVDVKQGQYLSELRRASVCFVNMSGLEMDKGGEGSGWNKRQEQSALEQLHSVCQALQSIIAVNQGYRRQFLVDDKGTVLIVVFGVPPYAHEDDAYRALKTALEVRKLLSDAKVHHGIGIATGEVYVGSVGSTLRKDHAVVGDTVNLAARLSGKAKSEPETFASNVLLDTATNAALRQQVSLRGVGSIQVKGKKEEIAIFTPANLSEVAAFPQISSAQLLSMATIGRDAEKERFVEALDTCMQLMAGGKLLVLRGQSGMGKTALAREFISLVDEQSGSNLVSPFFFTAHPSLCGGSLLALWRALLLHMAGLSENGLAEQADTKKSKRQTAKDEAAKIKQVEELVTLVQPRGTVGNFQDERVPLLNLLLGTSFPPTSLTLRLMEDEQGIQFYLTTLVQDLMVGWMTAKKQALVVIVDDAHQLDDDSLQVLSRVVHLTRNHPLLLVLTSRPSEPSEQTNAWDHQMAVLEKWREDVGEEELLEEEEEEEEKEAAEGRGQKEERKEKTEKGAKEDGVVLELEGLDEQSMQALVERELAQAGLGQVPELVKKAIKVKSEGNPLYAHEVTAHLVQAGVVRMQDGAVQVDEAKLNTLDLLPSSLNALTTFRIDNLPLEQTLICKLLSAFGEEPVELHHLQLLYLKEAETLEIKHAHAQPGGADFPRPEAKPAEPKPDRQVHGEEAKSNDMTTSLALHLRTVARLLSKARAAKQAVNQRKLLQRLDDSLVALLRQEILGTSANSSEAASPRSAGQHAPSEPLDSPSPSPSPLPSPAPSPRPTSEPSQVHSSASASAFPLPSEPNRDSSPERASSPLPPFPPSEPNTDSSLVKEPKSPSPSVLPLEENSHSSLEKVSSPSPAVAACEPNPDSSPLPETAPSPSPSSSPEQNSGSSLENASSPSPSAPASEPNSTSPEKAAQESVSEAPPDKTTQNRPVLLEATSERRGHNEAQRRHAWRSTFKQQDTFFFSQSYLRRACYKLLLFSQRARLHYAIAEILQERSEGDELAAEQVSYHFKCALEASGGVKAAVPRHSHFPPPKAQDKDEAAETAVQQQPQPADSEALLKEKSQSGQGALLPRDSMRAHEYLRRRSLLVQSTLMIKRTSVVTIPSE